MTTGASVDGLASPAASWAQYFEAEVDGSAFGLFRALAKSRGRRSRRHAELLNWRCIPPDPASRDGHEWPSAVKQEQDFLPRPKRIAGPVAPVDRTDWRAGVRRCGPQRAV